MGYRIPFNRACFVGTEHSYMAAAVEGGHISGDGPFTRRCSELLEEALGARRVMLTTSCTHALELAALLLDVGPGDEVILPTFTFVSTANAFALRGATPVFADIRPDTLNIDETQLQHLITERTRVIVPVHYAGVGCEMDAILDLASDAGIAVVEDNAHGLFGSYRGRPLGSLGSLATQSFHETKNITCGEGGALVVNDPALVDRAEVLREKGTDRARFLRGQVDKYTWVDLGSSWLPSDLLAAVLLAQLEARERIQTARRGIWQRYATELASWAEKVGARLPSIPAHCEHPSHLFQVILATERQRDALIDSLRTAGILAVFHYVPLHTSAMGRRFGGMPGDCPVAEDLAPRLVRLPFFTGMSEEEQEAVIGAVQSARLG